MEKKTVMVLFGGESSEYGVSLQSASSVIRALDKEKYEVVLVGINERGEWFQFVGDPDLIEKNQWQDPEFCYPVILSPDKSIRGLICETRITPIDVAFPVLHGKNGEDGTVQGLLELAGIPYAGCKVLASALCMDKVKAHDLVRLNGIRVAKSVTVQPWTEFEDICNSVRMIGYPVFIKPVNAGSSYGISKIYKEEDLKEAIKTAFRYDREVVIEEMIDGFEVGCAIIGKDNEIMIGEVDEIELSSDFFDFKEKYINNSSKTYVPARISKEESSRIKDTAKQIYQILGCSGFARVDMFYTPDKEIVFNEVNTIPGFTSHSRFPNMMKACGVSFEETVEKIVELAMR